MSSYKVNYSELVTALQDHKQGTSNRLLKKLLPNLKTYLNVVMDANAEDAEEAVHRAFLSTYEKIMEDKIKNKKYVYKYLMQASRHAYIRIKKREERFTELDSLRVAPGRQIDNLLDEDRQRILKSCLEKLPDASRDFIMYVFRYPDATSISLSEHFDITTSNARVKKMRIINTLGECVNKQWDG